MKLVLASISLFTLLIASFALTETAFGLGPSVSGGPSAAPRAIVIQAWAIKGTFDEVGLQSARSLAGQHVAANRIVTFNQRDEAQDSDRKALCLEYRDFADFETATNEFRQALANNPSLEVVSNGICR